MLRCGRLLSHNCKKCVSGLGTHREMGALNSVNGLQVEEGEAEILEYSGHKGHHICDIYHKNI